ncbi:Ig-like domain-containing protein [Brevibacillus brevis]|nr:Ig-like domain-containing protein [Brevibacillus brevis]
MSRGKDRKTSWISAVLSFLLLVTTLLPMGAGVAQAAGGGISFTGISDKTTATSPHISYTPKITIQGTYNGIVGEDLRYRVATLNGSEPNDTSSIKPYIDSVTRTFTFRDIELTPGVNQIKFEIKSGDSTTYLPVIFVQYNNTPLFSNLKLNSVMFETDPTIVEVTSSSKRQLTLALSGKAMNADTVVVTNQTTGQNFSDSTSSSGSFSIELDAQIGLNKLDIRAFSKNREVGLINRSVLVLPKSNTQGGADQFYNVTINAGTETPIIKVPPAKNELIQTGTSGTDFPISGELLVKLQNGVGVLNGALKDTTPPDAPKVNRVYNTTTEITGFAEAGSKVKVSKGNIVKEATADAYGTFKVAFDKQSEDVELQVTATDADNNVSQVTYVKVEKDRSAPDKPIVNPISEKTTSVTGTAEPDSTITVKNGTTVLVTGTTGKDSKFSFTIPNQPLDAEITVTATDETGNESAATIVKVTDSGDTSNNDTTPPDAPVVDALDDTAASVKGKTEAGATVFVAKNGSVVASAPASGNDFEVKTGGFSAGDVLTVYARDAKGNQGPATTVKVASSDTTKPTVPTVNPIMNTDTKVTGTAEAGSTVIVKKGATELGSAKATGTTGTGTYSVTIPRQKFGDVLSVTATDSAGNVSDAVTKKVDSDKQNGMSLTLDDLATNQPVDVTATNVVATEVTNVPLSSEYKLYKVTGNIPANDLKTGKTYEMKLKYSTVIKSTDPSIPDLISEAVVGNHAYQFVYKSSSDPRFGKVFDISTTTAQPEIRTDGSVNVVSALPVKVKVEAFNMPAGAAPNTANFEVYYNNTKRAANTDYVITTRNNEINIEFVKFPANETNVKVVYTNGTQSNTSDDKDISFKLSPEVVPSLLFYYTTSFVEKVIDSTLEIPDPRPSNFAIDGNVFRGKMYNYKLNSGNMVITLNNNKTKVAYNVISTIDGAVQFTIDKNQFTSGSAWNLNQGNNTLIFELTDEPNVKFTYNIFYNTEKTPKIQNVKMKVVQGKDNDVELEKKSTDKAFQTSAYFLRQFTFDVENVEQDAVVTIRKDGNVIAKYKMTDDSGDWDFLDNDSDYRKARDAAIKGNTSDLGTIFDDSTFSRGRDTSNTFKFNAEMSSRDYGEELIGELDGDMGLSAEDLESRLKLFPLTLSKGTSTNYEIEVTQGSIITRQTVSINQDTQAWTVVSPKKLANAQYITVNSNSVPLRIFAEKATKVMIGKTEAVAYNTKDPDFEYDEDTGKLVPESYYVFEANVALKPGLNTIKYTVQFGANSYKDEVKIYNTNSAVGGAESREVLGKKLAFSVFDKSFELKFPKGTVLLAPSDNRTGSEINAPATDIFTDVPLYFGMADRTNGRVNLDDDELREDMEDLLSLSSDFNYASPLYFVDAGNSKPGAGDGDEDRAPGGRDPYFEGTVNNAEMEPFIKRWKNNLIPSKVGTVTIKYDGSIVNAANNILTVFYNNGDEWINLGGVVNTSKKTVTVPFEGFGYYMVMKTRETFSDVITHPFARDAIETLYAKGIMADAPGSGFGTELKITRGEFATMIVKALDLPINDGPYTDSRQNHPAEPTFTDVRPSDDDWNYQYKYIETAARAGIIRGKDPRAFYPDDSLTREEAAIIVARAMNLKLSTPEAAAIALGKMYTDAQLTGHYATPAVLAVSKAKIMNGEANDPTAKKPTFKFVPKGDLTRAEMAMITIRIMVQLKKLPKQ